jgi:phosphate starvation-inducible PhoH-like protein
VFPPLSSAAVPASHTLKFTNARQLSQLYCSHEPNLALVEQKLGVRIVTRDDWLKLDGSEAAVARGQEFFKLLGEGRSQGLAMRSPDFVRLLDAYAAEGGAERLRALFSEPLVIATNKKTIVPKTIGQKGYLQAIQKNPVVFGIGPAGTGKTYLAMAAAISALLKNQVQRIVLTRPAVEAGEALGFLPGDLREKILPYLRPLYDAMHDLLDAEDSARLAEKGIIEIAPLAYMRGRTLSGAYVILDEAQNTTPEQMMMFLTRLGDDSRMIVTGDITQIDLPRSKPSGLVQAPRILKDIPGIEFHYFTASDVVRHPLVQRIIDAYERARAAAETRAGPGPEHVT